MSNPQLMWTDLEERALSLQQQIQDQKIPEPKELEVFLQDVQRAVAMGPLEDPTFKEKARSILDIFRTITVQGASLDAQLKNQIHHRQKTTFAMDRYRRNQDQ